MLRIGHRGARGHAPENTLAAIEKAIGFRADMVEFDVQRTRDGQLVLLHDAMLDRTTDGHGAIAELSWDEVRRVRVGGIEPLPLLTDALRLTSGRAGVMIELKTEGIGREAVRLVRESRFQGAVVYASFLHDLLLEVRDADSDAQTLALIEAIPVDRTAFASDARATHVGVSFETLTESFVAALHARSLRVFVYTVNEPADIRAARAMGVDGIISDYPDRLL